MFDQVEELTASMSRGDSAAIEAFYRRYFDDMYLHARRVTRRDESFCLDVVQDAVLRIVRTVRPMVSQAHLENWLRVIVKTSAYDRLRQEKRQQRRDSNRPTHDQTVPDDETLEELRKALSQLDPEIVRMIELRYREGFTLRRLANLFQTTTSAIDGRLRRAIVKLRETLEST